VTGAKTPVTGEISSAMTPSALKEPDMRYQLSWAGGNFDKQGNKDEK
jgi:hypothetical protein